MRRLVRDALKGVLAVGGVAAVLVGMIVLALFLVFGSAGVVGAQDDDEMSACEMSCYEQEQACYETCDDAACEEACAAVAETCVDGCG